METSLFISLLNPAIALTLASAFFLLWLNSRERTYLLVLVAAYIASAAGFLLQYFTLPIGLPATKLLSAISFTVAAEALYHAKRDGRDSVRVSYQRAPEPPPSEAFARID